MSAKQATQGHTRAAKARTAAPVHPMPTDRDGRAASPSPVAKDRPIKVRAIEMGYYDHARRRPGDVFVIANEKAFSKRWMERVDANVPERTTTATEALRKQHDDIISGRPHATDSVL